MAAPSSSLPCHRSSFWIDAFLPHALWDWPYIRRQSEAIRKSHMYKRAKLRLHVEITFSMGCATRSQQTSSRKGEAESSPSVSPCPVKPHDARSLGRIRYAMISK